MKIKSFEHGPCIFLAIYLNHVFLQESAGFSQFQLATISKCGFFFLLIGLQLRERERERETHTHTHTNKHHTSSCKHGHEKRWWVALFFICKIQILSKWWLVALFSICNIQLLSNSWWVALFLFTTFKDFPSKGWIAFPFLHKNTQILPTAKKQSLRSTCGKGAISFVFLILVWI